MVEEAYSPIRRKQRYEEDLRTRLDEFFSSLKPQEILLICETLCSRICSRSLHSRTWDCEASCCVRSWCNTLGLLLGLGAPR